MNKKIISLLLGACLCTSLAGCGNADNNGGSVTKQKFSASKELGSDIAVGAKPAPVDSYEELKNGVNNFAFDLYDALPKCCHFRKMHTEYLRLQLKLPQ